MSILSWSTEERRLWGTYFDVLRERTGLLCWEEHFPPFPYDGDNYNWDFERFVRDQGRFAVWHNGCFDAPMAQRLSIMIDSPPVHHWYVGELWRGNIGDIRLDPTIKREIVFAFDDSADAVKFRLMTCEIE